MFTSLYCMRKREKETRKVLRELHFVRTLLGLLLFIYLFARREREEEEEEELSLVSVLLAGARERAFLTSLSSRLISGKIPLLLLFRSCVL